MISERNPEGAFMNQKKKMGKVLPLKPNTQPLKMQDQVQSDNGRKAQPLSSVTQCYQEWKKNVKPEIGALKYAFSQAQQLTTYMTT